MQYIYTFKRRSTAKAPMAVLLLWIIGVQFVLHSGDPFSADSGLKFAVSCHRASPDSGNIVTMKSGSAQMPGLSPGSSSQQAAHSHPLHSPMLQ